MFQIAVDGWRLGIRAVLRMPVLFLSALCLILGSNVLFLSGILFDHVETPTALNTLMTFGNDVVVALMWPSVLIAVHRFVLLDEHIDRPIWRLPSGYARFATYFVLLSVLTVPLSIIGSIIGPKYQIGIRVLDLAYLVAVTVASARIVLVFPASALNLGLVSWRDSWRDMRGHLWKLFGTGILVGLPMAAINIVAAAVLAPAVIIAVKSGLAPPPHWTLNLAVDGFVATSTLLLGSVYAVTVSRFYQLYGNALATPAQA